MHRHDALGRKQIVEDTEDTFLHLAGIGRAANQNQLLDEVYGDDRFAATTVAFRVCVEAWQVDDRIFGIELGELFSGGAHKERANEQIVPGEFIDDPYVDAVCGLRASKEIGDIELVLAGERLKEVSLEIGEMLVCNRVVVF